MSDKTTIPTLISSPPPPIFQCFSVPWDLYLFIWYKYYILLWNKWKKWNNLSVKYVYALLEIAARQINWLECETRVYFLQNQMSIVAETPIYMCIHILYQIVGWALAVACHLWFSELHLTAVTASLCRRSSLEIFGKSCMLYWVAWHAEHTHV